MEKEFIPYEQALALKELGFDEPCFGYFTGDLMHLVIRPAMSRVNEPESYVVTAPLYQQVFRWFREKYNLDSNITPIGINKRFYSIYIVDKKNDEIKGDGNLYDVYEEAELECLKKLIEIVKAKQK